MKTLALFMIALLLCLVYIPVEAKIVKKGLTNEPIRFVKRAPPAPPATQGQPIVPPKQSGPPPPSPPPPAVAGEEDDDKAAGSEKEPAIVPDAKGKQDLRTSVEALISLINGLRKNGAIRLPDPMERLFKAIIEAFEKLQDELNTDLDIDMGNLLNSGGK